MLSRFLDVISWGFLVIGVNGAPFLRRSSDIWVTGCNYVKNLQLLCGDAVIFHCGIAVGVLYCEIIHYLRDLASGPYPKPPEFSQRSYILFNFLFNFARNSRRGCSISLPDINSLYTS